MKKHGASIDGLLSMWDTLGPAMNGFFGARSECNHRLAQIEGAYLDFHAEYPAVMIVTGVLRFLVAERITVERGEAAMYRTREFLRPEGLMERLLEPETWKGLMTLVLVRPNGDRLPERCTFAKGEQAAGNIADCYQESGPEAWWYLADAAASVLRTGKVPDILDAITLIPHGRVETRPYALYGDERFTVDLTRDDLVLQLVRFRSEAECQAAALPEDDPGRRRLEGVADAAKIIVNGLYGITVEVNALPETVKGKPVTRYGMEVSEIWTRTPEKAGPRYAGPVGASITAGGRLLVAMAEQLGLDRGIRHAMCDTDSMHYGRPDSMRREDSWRRIDEIRAAFRRLDPFGDGQDFFELEDRNFALEWTQDPNDSMWKWTVNRDRIEPLYYIGVCPKRNVFYNLDPDGTPIIRAFSMHGVTLGNPEALDETDGEAVELDEDSIEEMDRQLAGYRSPPDIPEPRGDVAKMAGGVGTRWMYDQWYRLICKVRAGISRDRDVRIDDPALDVPAMRQVTASTPTLLDRYGTGKSAEKKGVLLRPFAFFTMAASFTQPIWINRTLGHAGRESYEAAIEEAVEPRMVEKEQAEEAWRRVWNTYMPGGIDPRSLGSDYRDIPRCLHRSGGLPVDVAGAQWDPPFDYVQDFVDYVARTYARKDALKSVSWRKLWKEQADIHDLDIVGKTLYAPYCQTGRELATNLRRADTGERVLLSPPTIREVMRDYFRRPNVKMADPRGIGAMEPRRLRIDKTVYILKESSRLLVEEMGEGPAALVTREAGEAGGLADRMLGFSLDELAWAIPEIKPKYLQRYHEGKHEPKAEHRALIMAGLVKLESGKRPPTWKETRPRLERRGVEPVAAQLGTRLCDLRRYLTRNLVPGRTLLWQIAMVLDDLDAEEARACSTIPTPRSTPESAMATR